MSPTEPVHRRRSIRLPDYDYSQPGAYFITMVTQDRLPRFGEIVRPGLASAQMVLNEYGCIATEQWRLITARFEHVETGAFVVMPDHVHGTIIIHAAVEAGLAPAYDGQPQGKGRPQGSPRPEIPGYPIEAGLAPAYDGRPQGKGRPQGSPRQGNTIGDIVGAYKSIVANECLKIYKSKNEIMGKFWQRNYYEHIIRSEEEYQRIHMYIEANPANWINDDYHPGKIK